MKPRLCLGLVGLSWLLASTWGTTAEPVPSPLRSIAFSVQAADPGFDTHRFLFSPEVVADVDGTVRLAHSVLLADEMGATDFHQGEPLSERLHAKKIFLLESADVSRAELFIFGSAKTIHVNGKALDKSERLISTGWSRVLVPSALLRIGDNEVILSGGGHLLVEASRRPGRSFKSSDGGRTWTNQAIGRKDDQPGEYLVRLRLGCYASHGRATSQVFDLWSGNPTEVARPAKLFSVTSLAELSRQQPEGTQLVASLRTGSTPSPDAKTWTDWISLDKDYRPTEAAQAHRWAQLQFDLRTRQTQATPRLPRQFQLTCEIAPESIASKGKLELRVTAGERPLLSSVPFVYQEPSPRLKLLRERYRLDEVIAPGKTEMEQLMLLRYWVRNQWHTAWGSHPANWMPPWDALIILESKDQPDCLTMCTHYACVFYQCCLALGWNARHCILDHHCVAEVWVDQHNQWVMMDAGNSKERADVGLHFEKDSIPLSARELHLAQRSGKTDGITVHFTPADLAAKIAPLCRAVPKSEGKATARPDVIPLAGLPQYPVCQLNNYRRYAFPGRNNFLSTLLPGELYQGWAEYFYDGYWWVGDTPDDPRISPEYSWLLNPARAADMDWKLNWTRIHLSHTANPGELRVDLETFTPNLLRLEQWVEPAGKTSKEGWQTAPASFVWKVGSGENVLRVRSVNQWERAGREAKVEVRWTVGE